MIPPATPAECVRTFGVPHAALYPLLRQRVRTPHGTGVLVRVFEDTPERGGAMVLHDEATPFTREWRCSQVEAV